MRTRFEGKYNCVDIFYGKMYRGEMVWILGYILFIFNRYEILVLLVERLDNIINLFCWG